MLPRRKKKSAKQLSREKELSMTDPDRNNITAGKTDQQEKKKKREKEERPKMWEPASEYYAPEKFYPARNIALVHTDNGGMYMVPCNVYSNGTLSYPCPAPLKNTSAYKDVFGERDQIMARIAIEPEPLRIPYRDTMPTRLGRFFSPEYMTFMAYSVHPNKSFTFDPSVGASDVNPITDAEHRALMELAANVLEADWKGNITKDMRRKKEWWDYLPHILLVGQTIVFLMFLALTG